jgi:uncharacterized repeat protein (TIGR03987 family)
MTPLLLTAVLLFTIAMVFYTWGIWAEKLAGRLKRWHVYMFACGVSVDVLATISSYIVVGGLVWTPHSIMGFISLGLMMIHFVWAIRVIERGEEHALTNFHKLSLFVWSIWMVSYLSGFVLGMGKIG